MPQNWLINMKTQYYNGMYDEGFGKIVVVQKWMTEEEAIDWFNSMFYITQAKTIKECMDTSRIYFVEPAN